MEKELFAVPENVTEPDRIAPSNGRVMDRLRKFARASIFSKLLPLIHAAACVAEPTNHTPTVGGDEQTEQNGGRRTPEDPVPSCSIPNPERFPHPLFADEASSRGITHQTNFPSVFGFRSGPGVCLADIDGDGDLDAYFVSGDGNRLYENDGAGNFSIASSAAVRGPNTAFGCGVFDYNGDGLVDIAATGLGTRLYSNEGNFAFRDVTEDAGFEVPSCFSFATTAADIDGDGDIDLAVSCYLNDTVNGLEPLHLFVNHLDEGQERFTEEARERGITGLNPAYVNLFTDLDGDGDMDLFQGNDNGGQYPENFFVNDGNGFFEDRAEDFGLHFAYYPKGHSPRRDSADTMGVAIADIDGDLVGDVMVTNYPGRPSPLVFDCDRQDDGNIRCREIAEEIGIQVDTVVGWGIAAEDFDNDGDRDIFEATASHTEEDDSRWPRVTPNQLLENVGGHFERYVPAGASDPLSPVIESYGVAAGDIDGDGDVDLIVGNYTGRPGVLINQSSDKNHSVKVALRCDAPNPFCYGASVRVTPLTEDTCVQEREIIPGGSFAGYTEPSAGLHFGIGRAAEARISITWPDGTQNKGPVLPASNATHIIDWK